MILDDSKNKLIKYLESINLNYVDLEKNNASNKTPEVCLPFYNCVAEAKSLKFQTCKNALSEGAIQESYLRNRWFNGVLKSARKKFRNYPRHKNLLMIFIDTLVWENHFDPAWLFEEDIGCKISRDCKHEFFYPVNSPLRREKNIEIGTIAFDSGDRVFVFENEYAKEKVISKNFFNGYNYKKFYKVIPIIKNWAKHNPNSDKITTFNYIVSSPIDGDNFN